MKAIKSKAKMRTAVKHGSPMEQSAIRNISSEISQLFMKKYANVIGKYSIEKIDDINSVPELIKLMEFIRKDISAPLPTDATVKSMIGVFTRDASSRLEGPDDNCALRILFNIGEGEVYDFDSTYKKGDQIINSGLNEKTHYLKANSYYIMQLGNCEYQINVTANTVRDVPSDEDDVMKPWISRARSRYYRRVVVIIDYIVSKEAAAIAEKATGNNVTQTKIDMTKSKKIQQQQIRLAEKKILEQRTRQLADDKLSLLAQQMVNKNENQEKEEDPVEIIPISKENELLMDNIINENE